MGNGTKMAKGFAVLIVNLLTVFSLAVTTISPRQIINLTSSLASQQAIENQPILQFYSSISMIPINMVSKMFGEKFSGIKAASRNKSHDKNDKNRTCSDLSFALPSTSSNILKTLNLQNASFLPLSDALSVSSPDGQLSLLTASSGQGILFLFILLFLITLRRRSLPAPYMNKTIYIKNPIRNAKWIGFFNFRRDK
jgi:hypothetical protein